MCMACARLTFISTHSLNLHAEVESPQAPYFVKHPIDLTTAEGEDVTFTCVIRGQPSPKVMWEKDGVVVSTSHKYKVTSLADEHTLTIVGADHADEGEFVCHAHNTRGSTSHICLLHMRNGDEKQSGGLWNQRLKTSNTDGPTLLRSHSRVTPGKLKSAYSTYDRTAISRNIYSSYRQHQPTSLNSPALQLRKVGVSEAKSSSVRPCSSGRITLLNKSPAASQAESKQHTPRAVVRLAGVTSKENKCGGSSEKPKQGEKITDYRSVLKPRIVNPVNSDATKNSGKNYVDFKEILSKSKQVDVEEKNTLQRGKLQGCDAPSSSAGSGVGLGSELQHLQMVRRSRNVITRSGDKSVREMSSYSSEHASGSKTHREFSFQRTPPGVNPVGLKAVNRSLGALKACEENFGGKEATPRPLSARLDRPKAWKYSPSSSLEFDAEVKSATSEIPKTTDVTFKATPTVINQTSYKRLDTFQNRDNSIIGGSESNKGPSSRLWNGFIEHEPPQSGNYIAQYEFNIVDKLSNKVGGDTISESIYSHHHFSQDPDPEPDAVPSTSADSHSVVQTGSGRSASSKSQPFTTGSILIPTNSIYIEKVAASETAVDHPYTSTSMVTASETVLVETQRPTSISPFQHDTSDEVFASHSDLSFSSVTEETPIVITSVCVSSRDSGRSSDYTNDVITSAYVSRDSERSSDYSNDVITSAYVSRDSERSSDYTNDVITSAYISRDSERSSDYTNDEPVATTRVTFDYEPRLCGDETQTRKTSYDGSGGRNDQTSDQVRMGAPWSARETKSTSSSIFANNRDKDDFRKVRLKPVQGTSNEGAELKKSKFVSRSTDNLFTDVKLKPVSKRVEFNSSCDISKDSNSTKHVPKSNDLSRASSNPKLVKGFTAAEKVSAVTARSTQQKFRSEISTRVSQTESGKKTIVSNPNGANLIRNRASCFELNTKQPHVNSQKRNSVEFGKGDIYRAGGKTQSPREIAARFEASSKESLSSEKGVSGTSTTNVTSKPPVHSRSINIVPGNRSQLKQDSSQRKSVDLTNDIGDIKDVQKSSKFMEKLRQWKAEEVSAERPMIKTLKDIGKSYSNSSLATSSDSGPSHLDNIPEWVKKKALAKRGSLQLDKSSSLVLSQPELRGLTLSKFSEETDELKVVADSVDSDSPKPNNQDLTCGRGVEENIRSSNGITKTSRLVGVEKGNIWKENSETNIMGSSTTQHKDRDVEKKAHDSVKDTHNARTLNNETKRWSSTDVRLKHNFEEVNDPVKSKVSINIITRGQENEIESPRISTNNKNSTPVNQNSENPHSDADSKPLWAKREPVVNIEAKIKAQSMARAEKDDSPPMWAGPKLQCDVKDVKIDRHTENERRRLGTLAKSSNDTDTSLGRVDFNPSLVEPETKLKPDASLKSLNDGYITSSYNNIPEDEASSPPQNLKQRDATLLDSERIRPSPKTTYTSSQKIECTNKEPVHSQTEVSSPTSTPASPQQSTKNNSVAKPSWMKKQRSLRHIPIYPILDNELSPRYEPLRPAADDTSSITSNISTTSLSSTVSDVSNSTADSGYVGGRDNHRKIYYDAGFYQKSSLTIDRIKDSSDLGYNIVSQSTDSSASDSALRDGEEKENIDIDNESKTNDTMVDSCALNEDPPCPLEDMAPDSSPSAAAIAGRSSLANRPVDLDISTWRSSRSQLKVTSGPPSNDTSVCLRRPAHGQNDADDQVARRSRGRLDEITSSVQLEVTSPVKSIETRPRFKTEMMDVRVMYGSRAVLKCLVEGNPRPEVQWKYGDVILQNDSEFEVSHEQDETCVVVKETFHSHIGQYTCVAWNCQGRTQSTARLSLDGADKAESRAFEGPVSRPPRIEGLNPRHLTVTRGSTYTLTVTFTGEPRPEVKWTQGDQEIESVDGQIEIMGDTGNSILTVHSCQRTDGGKITACVSNSLGSDSATATICIEDVPDAPIGQPQVYDVTPTSASLSWCGPSSEEGNGVTYYVIEAKTKNQKNWDVVVPQCKDQCEHIHNLRSCTAYQFRVRAANRHGLGAPSEASQRITTPELIKSPMDDLSDDELPFDPRDVNIKTSQKFEDFYDVGDEVGKGKFGVVYRCTEKATGQVWAAKVLKVREKDKGAVRQEVEVMNCLRHPKLLLLWDAYESPRRMVLIMEFIGAGELFERVIGDDFVLTERDCVHFLRQICEGVQYMHMNSVVHLDLKPENILCIAENSNRIKIIDFGLARFYKKGEDVKVMAGTPEFIAPEVINYDEVDFTTDMWSVGVICYVLISGLSPFLGDNDAETLSNVTSGEFDFEDEAFEGVSDRAKDFMSKLILKRKGKRMLTEQCLEHEWLADDDADGMRYKRLNTERLRRFMARRKWLKTGNAVRALNRMMRSSSMGLFGSKDSTSSAPTTPTSPGTPVSLDLSVDAFPSQAALKEEEEPTSTTPTSSTSSNRTLNGSENVALNNANNSESDGNVRNSEVNGLFSASRTLNGGPDSPSLENDPAKVNDVSKSDSPPVFECVLSDCEACAGDAVRFDVTLSGKPRPRVTWLFEGEELQQDSRHALEETRDSGVFSLVIRNVDDGDEGEYTCRAHSSSGQVTCSAELSVIEL